MKYVPNVLVSGEALHKFPEGPCTPQWYYSLKVVCVTSQNKCKLSIYAFKNNVDNLVHSVSREL